MRLEEAARDRGFSVIVLDIKEMTVRNIQYAIDELRDQQVAGIQFNLPLPIGFTFRREIAKELPVMIYDLSLGPQFPSVVFKHQAAACLVTDHLLDLGHEKIVHLGGPETWIAGDSRRVAFLRTLRKRGSYRAFIIKETGRLSRAIISYRNC